MRRLMAYIGQGAVYVLIALVLGALSDTPAWHRLSEGEAQLSLSLAHSGRHEGECRRLTAKEIAALPAGERRPLDCARGRLPVHVELELNGRVLVNRTIAPSGLFGDGPSQIYENFSIPSGRHVRAARRRYSDRTEGFDYERSVEVEIKPQQRFVIEFRSESGGFLFSSDAAAGRNGIETPVRG